MATESVWDRLERHGNYDVHDIADAIARGRLLEARDKAVTEAIEKERWYATSARLSQIMSPKANPFDGPTQELKESAAILALCNTIDKAREAAK